MAYTHEFYGRQEVESTDLSPSVTTVAVDPILPPLRVPVRAVIEDDPSRGPYVLVFKNEAAWRRAWRDCEQKITAQCQDVARKACSINATKACNPPWWKRIFPWLNTSTQDREACEEKHMMACLADAKQQSIHFATSTCKEVFREARIATEGRYIDPRFMVTTQKRVRRPNAKVHEEYPLESKRSGYIRGRLLI